MSDIFEKDLVIQNIKGLHARAAATFVKTLENVDADVFVSKGGQKAGGDSIMGLMMLAASKGTVIHIKATGKEADKAINLLTDLINSKFGEE